MKKINKKAFTLIELLVVVLIIGILAAIAVPQYQKSVIKAEYSKLKLLVKAISQAEEEYFLATGEYTGEIDSLTLSWPEHYIEKGCSIYGCEYTFVWGYCSLNHTGDTPRVVCEDSGAHIRYRQIFTNANQFAGKQGCSADQEYTNAIKVCQSETGKTEADSGYTHKIYYY